MAAELLLVSGLNYPKYKEDESVRNRWTWQGEAAGPWREYSLRVAKRALRADPSLRVTLFDFFTGTRETVALDKRRRLTPTVDETIGALDFSNYRRLEVGSGSTRLVPPTRTIVASEKPHVYYFTGVGELSASAVPAAEYRAAFYGPASSPPAERSISITDVYAYVESVGADRTRAITDFHFFSHGYAGGPILVNTIDLAREEGTRDALDKDGRRDDDFPGALTNALDFANAFAPGATSRIWGCNVWTFMKRLILETIRQKKGLRDRDAKRLRFVWNSDWSQDAEYFRGILGGSGATSDYHSVNDIAAKLRDACDQTYMKQLAAASGNRVLGGLPGTYSDLDRSERYGLKLLHVPMGKPFEDKDDFRGLLRFYKDVVGTSFEPKEGYSKEYGRGFGLYT